MWNRVALLSFNGRAIGLYQSSIISVSLPYRVQCQLCHLGSSQHTVKGQFQQKCISVFFPTILDEIRAHLIKQIRCSCYLS